MKIFSLKIRNKINVIKSICMKHEIIFLLNLHRRKYVTYGDVRRNSKKKKRVNNFKKLGAHGWLSQLIKPHVKFLIQ